MFSTESIKYPNKALARRCVWIPVGVKQPSSEANDYGHQEQYANDWGNVGSIGIFRSICNTEIN